MNIETIKATISAAVVIIVAFLGAVGIEADAGLLSNVLHAAAFLIAVGWGVWKNHNFTAPAQDAQAFLDMLKANPAEPYEDEEF